MRVIIEARISDFPVAGACRAAVVPYRQERVLKSNSTPTAIEVATPAWLLAVRAAESKKAIDIRFSTSQASLLSPILRYCTGANQRQVQAIATKWANSSKKRPANSQQSGRIQPGGMGAGGLWRPVDPYFFAQVPRILRSGTALAKCARQLRSRLSEDLTLLHRQAKRPARQRHRGGFLERAARYAACEMREIGPIARICGPNIPPHERFFRPRRQAPRFQRHLPNSSPMRRWRRAICSF